MSCKYNNFLSLNVFHRELKHYSNKKYFLFVSDYHYSGNAAVKVLSSVKL